MKARNIFSVMADMAAVFLFVYLLVFPEYATEPTRYALEFCAKTLVPSLFIYMVLAKMVITLPITDKLTKILGLEAVMLITGTLCGCPVGAKNAVSLYESGRINKNYAEYLCSFSNNASVSFVVGFVGAELFGDVKIGIKLLIFQLIASAITAAVMKFVIFGKKEMPTVLPCKSNKVGLREAVADSALTMINLCACVTFFIVAGGAVTRIITLPPIWNAVFKSVLEFSSGCAATAGLDSGFALPITAFAVGHTGFSVALQVKSVIGNKLGFRPFLLGKLICCFVMTVLAFIFG